MPSRSDPMGRNLHEQRAASDASTVMMFSRLPSSEPEHAFPPANPSTSSDAEHVLLVIRLRLYSLQLRAHSEASASSAHDDHAASPHQHPATHHHDPASLCTTSASDFVRGPSNIGVRRMFDLMEASCDPASQRGPCSNIEENVEALKTSRTGAVEAGLVG
ncbi:hypothetical protein T484DRAFT_1918986 [Baffinella frigidus]|nr:hypothetical protein T484DRAFT_1918986 [Cryptophyta sp. CCMP2293]